MIRKDVNKKKTTYRLHHCRNFGKSYYSWQITQKNH